MSFINALLRPLFDALLYPFRDLPAMVGITVVSLLTAIGLLTFSPFSPSHPLGARAYADSGTMARVAGRLALSGGARRFC